MPVIAVVNRKGGSGKSTFAAHVAAWCARQGHAVMLGDVDRQQSSRAWLRRRHPELPAIAPWALDQKNVLRVPTGITHVVLDTPGGLHGFELARIVMFADAIVMPVCASVFDRESAAACLAELQRMMRRKLDLAAVGMRVDGRTNAGEVLKQWAEGVGVPLLGTLRETQVYVRCLERGLTVFDLPASQAATDTAQWAPILDWLRPIAEPPQAANDAPGVRPAARMGSSRPQNLMPAQESMVPGARLTVLSGAKPMGASAAKPALARPAQGAIPGFLRR